MSIASLRTGKLAPKVAADALRPSRRAWMLSGAGGLGLGWLAYGGFRGGRVEVGNGRSAVEPIIESTALADDHVLAGAAASRFCILLLEDAERQLTGVSDLRATFYKRERVNGELTDLNVMDLKVRRAPLSVYMRWREPYAGREIIWQEDANDGQILVHAGGWQRKIVPLLRLDPLGERAMEYNRRPVTQIGLWNFNRRLLDNLRVDLEHPDVKVWMTQDKKVGGREAYCFRVVHTDRAEQAAYHKMLMYIDQQLGLPVACELYGWPELEGGDPPLEESYAFNDLQLEVGLSDLDFDITNPEYEFRSRPRKSEE
ncbi:MAG: DUF1571 domain-containing protein [Planctomycetaceae bacterium]|nr:DUF1571 domain-containing protein [Planctomycetaceae bacterium]